jgi:hypothetical protein
LRPDFLARFFRVLAFWWTGFIPEGVAGELTEAHLPSARAQPRANSSIAKITASSPCAQIAAASSYVSCGPSTISGFRTVAVAITMPTQEVASVQCHKPQPRKSPRSTSDD